MLRTLSLDVRALKRRWAAAPKPSAMVAVGEGAPVDILSSRMYGEST
jgi:hypothetical protein